MFSRSCIKAVIRQPMRKPSGVKSWKRQGRHDMNLRKTFEKDKNLVDFRLSMRHTPNRPHELDLSRSQICQFNYEQAMKVIDYTFKHNGKLIINGLVIKIMRN